MKLCDILQVVIRSERDIITIRNLDVCDIILYLERAKHTTFFRGVAAVRNLDDCGARRVFNAGVACAFAYAHNAAKLLY